MTLPGPHAAYLRVYEPVTAFPEPDRAAWASYAKVLLSSNEFIFVD